MPVGLHVRTFDRIASIRRELALIAADPSAGDVPTRVVALAEEFAALLGEQLADDGEALRRAEAEGRERIDLGYHVPAELAPVARSVLARVPLLLGDVDRYCEDAAGLITTPAPPDEAAYRRWVFGEPVLQLDGAAPTPWP